ncbi:MAG: hypothetical protein HeimC3_28350 [Candidatus Heimdallarchaeota archaeon LC_3]|nr:MAG: hypothetical protein HeimC3_28350 [Candidatus Heimdallarchaeota archaeon LC_3]
MPVQGVGAQIKQYVLRVVLLTFSKFEMIILPVSNAQGIVHVLNDSLCLQCFACEVFCPVDAIFINPPELNFQTELIQLHDKPL